MAGLQYRALRTLGLVVLIGGLLAGSMAACGEPRRLPAVDTATAATLSSEATALSAGREVAPPWGTPTGVFAEQGAPIDHK